MNGKELFNAMNGLDSDLIEKYAPNDTESVKILKHKRIFKIGALVAACVAVMLSVTACALEAKEYDRAVSFFDEYNISTKDLKRKEIKAVYRDITTNSFSYSKTNEVIEKNIISNFVSGYELSQNSTPNYSTANASLLSSTFLGDAVTDPADGSRYKIGHFYKHSYTESGDTEDKLSDSDQLEPIDNEFDRIEVRKYDKSGKALWCVETDEFDAYDIKIFGDFIVVHGYRYVTENQSIAYLMKISKDGKKLWTACPHRDELGFLSEQVDNVIENDKNELIVFTKKADSSYIGIFDSDGNRVLTKKLPFIGYVKNAAALSDGYIAEVCATYPEVKDEFYFLDAQCNVTDSFKFTDGESEYYFTDITEYGGKIYLSGYAVPESDSLDGTYHAETAQIADKLLNVLNGTDIDENSISSTDDEAVTRLIKDNYTAMLFVCGRDDLRPKEYYSISGALGSKLMVNGENELIWSADSISKVTFSPYTSAYSFYGKCKVYRYYFDAEGGLIRAEKTRQSMDFAR